jgi:uncharacterized protein
MPTKARSSSATDLIEAIRAAVVEGRVRPRHRFSAPRSAVARLRARDKTLGWTDALTLAPATLLLAWQSVTAQLGVATGTPVTFAQFMEPTYGAHLLANATKPAQELVGVVMVLPGMLLGIWAARRQFLDRPAEHRTSLRRAALGLLALALIGRLPAALLAAGVWNSTSIGAQWMVAIAHDLTGYAGGIGLAAAGSAG